MIDKARILAIAIALLTSCQNRPPAEDLTYKVPTAIEVFHLRSECAKLGVKIMEENFGARSVTQESHYNPKTNRCYVRLTDSDKRRPRDNYGVNLYDGQTREMLAFVQVEHGEKVGMVFVAQLPGEHIKGPNPGEGLANDFGFAEAREFINKAMEDDRRQ